ncbi:MAG: DUF3124 domain-containing protein [Hyphomicrobium sp.]|nr:DUF3124 domain-containing protein [Hyphomicrobium sp.]
MAVIEKRLSTWHCGGRRGAEEPVYEPVVEAVMISAAGTQGLSLLSPARVLEERLP